MSENKEVKELVSQLLENHRVAISTIAHEVRNPLTLVSSSLQVMEAQHPEVKEFSHWQNTMEDVAYMCQLLQELSTFNNGEILHYSVFSIKRLLQNVAVSFAMSLSDDTRIEFASSIDSSLGDFTGDKVKLQEVLLNLLKNAKESIAKKGTIHLDAVKSEKSVTITCKDSGCGIEEDKLQSIFEPFTTYKEGGTGLGLALAKRIVESHDGTICVTSKPGKGSTFTIVLPA